MYTSDDILKRLRAGETAENIANEIADVLNEANRIYIDEKNAKEAEEAINERRLDDLNVIMDQLNDWFLTYYNTECHIDGQKLIDAVEAFNKLGNIFDKLGDKTKIIATDVDSLIDAFLNTL